MFNITNNYFMEYRDENFEYENLGAIKVDSGISEQYEDSYSEDMIGNRTNNMLINKMYEIFINSPFHNKYKTPKRIDKEDRIKMYFYFKDILKKENKYTLKEIFISFAEFFQINYGMLYNDLNVLDKEIILREMNDKNKIKHKLNSNKLF